METQVITLSPGSAAPTRRDWSPNAHPAAHGMLAHTPDPKGYHYGADGRTVIPRADRNGLSTGFSVTGGVIVNIDPTNSATGEGGLSIDLRKITPEASDAGKAAPDAYSAWEAVAKYASAGGPAPASPVTAGPPVQTQQFAAVASTPATLSAFGQKEAPMPVPSLVPPAPVAPQPVAPQPVATVPQLQAVAQPVFQPVAPQPDQSAALFAAMQQMNQNFSSAMQQQQAYYEQRFAQLQAPAVVATVPTPPPTPAPAAPVVVEAKTPEPTEPTKPVSDAFAIFVKPPVRPKESVIFHMAGGLLRQNFHHIAIRGSSIMLFLDTRYEGDSCFIPSPTAEDETMPITLPGRKDAKYNVSVLPLSNQLGHIDIIQLLIVEPEAEKPFMEWTPDDAENIAKSL